MKITNKLKYVLFILLLIVPVILLCSDDNGDDDWCPGQICNNCATDCPDLNCPAGQESACVGGAYFDADENLRCAFCE